MTNVGCPSAAPYHVPKRSSPSEHTEPEEQSLPTCSENPAVDRCPATAGVDVQRTSGSRRWTSKLVGKGPLKGPALRNHPGNQNHLNTVESPERAGNQTCLVHRGEIQREP